jgi:hypothetical protein
MREVNSFDVFSRLVELDDKALVMAPLYNIVNLKKVKAGTNVTIGVAGDKVASIYNGCYVGGLILCEVERFRELKAAMEQENRSVDADASA